MSHLHGNSQTGNRPGCWSRVDVYDSENRECRGCGFQESCRAQVIKTINTQQQAAVQQVSNVPSPYYSPGFPPQTQYAVPQQVPVYQPQLQPRPFMPLTQYAAAPSYAAPPQRVGPPQPAPQAPPQQQMPQQMQQAPVDWYGRMTDPLFFQILSPPPFRAQMQGETFVERVGKNMMLDMGTMAFFHLGLALRQMFLPPQPLQPQQPREKDVTPR